MPRFIAFLRAVNVGGRTVKMEQLRRLFESLGFSGVETFIASGNVIFETRSKNARALERRIEEALGEALGFGVETFLRTDAELAEVAGREPFPAPHIDAAAALNVAFLKDAPDAEAERRLRGLRPDVDDFRVRGREVYWLCRRKQGESDFSNAVLEKTLGRRSTMRSVNTVKKLAAKYPPRR